MRKQVGRNFWFELCALAAVVGFSLFSYFQLRRPSKINPEPEQKLAKQEIVASPTVRGPAALQKLLPAHSKVVDLGCFSPGKHSVSSTENSLVRIKAKLCKKNQKYNTIEAWLDESPVLIYNLPEEISSNFINLKDGSNLIKISASNGKKIDTQEIELIRKSLGP